MYVEYKLEGILSALFKESMKAMRVSGALGSTRGLSRAGRNQEV